MVESFMYYVDAVKPRCVSKYDEFMNVSPLVRKKIQLPEIPEGCRPNFIAALNQGFGILINPDLTNEAANSARCSNTHITGTMRKVIHKGYIEIARLDASISFNTDNVNAVILEQFVQGDATRYIALTYKENTLLHVEVAYIPINSSTSMATKTSRLNPDGVVTTEGQVQMFPKGTTVDYLEIIKKLVNPSYDITVPFDFVAS